MGCWMDVGWMLDGCWMDVGWPGFRQQARLAPRHLPSQMLPRNDPARTILVSPSLLSVPAARRGAPTACSLDLDTAGREAMPPYGTPHTAATTHRGLVGFHGTATPISGLRSRPRFPAATSLPTPSSFFFHGTLARGTCADPWPRPLHEAKNSKHTGAT